MAKKELDRFDTKAKRDISLQTKLIGLIGGFILLGCSMVATISLTVFDGKLIKNTQDELKYTEQGAYNVMHDWLSTLALSSRLMANTPYIVDATKHENVVQAKAFLNKTTGDLDLGFTVVIDSKGAVVCSCGQDIGTGLASVKCVASALKGSFSRTFEPAGNLEFAALAASPVFDGGRLTGCVLTGYDLTGGSFTGLMRDGYNVECTVFRDDVRVDSTLEGVIGTKLDNEKIVSQVLTEGKTFEGTNTIKGKEYYSTYQPPSRTRTAASPACSS